MIFDRLCVGSANWGKEYNGVKVSEDDQKRILDYCREVGIDMIDTATAYEWDWTKIDPWFKVVVKVNAPMGAAVNISNVYCIMSHKEPHGWYIVKKGIKLGTSFYEPSPGCFLRDTCKVIQTPYSIYDRRFEPYFPQLKEQGIEIHVRSVFLRGKILVQFEPHDCIMFCLANPYIDRVILGADSYKQFKDNLFLLEEMCDSKKVDEQLLDPRNWKEEK